MIKRFAARSPRVACGLIYAAGYVAGSLLEFLARYLISGVWKPGATALGAGFGALGIFLAQRHGLVPQPQELNRPISLFGPRGFHKD
jgi:hypothetical protein